MTTNEIASTDGMAASVGLTSDSVAWASTSGGAARASPLVCRIPCAYSTPSLRVFRSP